MNDDEIKNILEAALLASGNPLTLDDLLGLFQGAENPPGRDTLRGGLAALAGDYEGRGIELKEVASGYRVQVRQGYAERIRGLWTERPGRYSRALLETLVLMAYRQPITRGEIEDIRGVAVSTNIIRTLQERDWIRVVGHRDVPGHPAMYGTTRQFLDYFNLKNLADLPSLAEIRDIDEITRDLFREQGIAVPDSFDGPAPEGDEAESGAAADTDGEGDGDDASQVRDADEEPVAPEDAALPEPPEGEPDHGPRRDGDGT